VTRTDCGCITSKHNESGFTYLVSFTEVHNLLLVRSRLGLGLGNDLGLLFCALAVNLSVLLCALAVDLSEASVDLVFENGERADTRLAPILQLLVDHLAFVAFVLDLPLNAVEQTMLDSELLLGVAFVSWTSRRSLVTRKSLFLSLTDDFGAGTLSGEAW